MTRNKELIVPRGMEASKMSWMALPVEPACIGKTCGVSRKAGAGATSFFARGAVVMEGVICVRT